MVLSPLPRFHPLYAACFGGWCTTSQRIGAGYPALYVVRTRTVSHPQSCSPSWRRCRPTSSCLSTCRLRTLHTTAANIPTAAASSTGPAGAAVSNTARVAEKSPAADAAPHVRGVAQGHQDASLDASQTAAGTTPLPPPSSTPTAPRAEPTAAKGDSMQQSANPTTERTNGDASSSNNPSGEEAKAKRTEEEKSSWWRSKWRAFKSEGQDFSLFYTPFYPATFLLLYAMFATNAVDKEALLDYVLAFFGDYVDRKAMHARIEAWNTWANLGFAFAINEVLEIVRFPLVVLLYYAMKPYSTHFAHWMKRWWRRIRGRSPTA